MLSPMESVGMDPVHFIVCCADTAAVRVGSGDAVIPRKQKMHRGAVPVMVFTTESELQCLRVLLYRENAHLFAHSVASGVVRTHDAGGQAGLFMFASLIACIWGFATRRNILNDVEHVPLGNGKHQKLLCTLVQVWLKWYKACSLVVTVWED